MRKFFLQIMLLLGALMNLTIVFGKNTDNYAIEYSPEDCKRTGIKPLQLSEQVIMPKHDGEYYFIKDNTPEPNSRAEELPKVSKITEIIHRQDVTTINISNISELISGGWESLDFKKLPIVINVGGDHAGLNAKIVILSLTFSQTDTKAQIGIVSQMSNNIMQASQNNEPTSLYFGADIALRKGGTLDGAFVLIAPREIELLSLNGIAKINLTAGTGVCFGCRASNGANSNAFLLNLVGQIVFDPSFAVAERADGKAITDDAKVAKLQFGIQVPSWNKFRIEATLPSTYGLQITRFPYIGFWAEKNTVAPPVASDILCNPSTAFSKNIVLDFTDTGSSFSVDNQTFNNIKGVIFQNFNIRLPRQIVDANGAPQKLKLKYFFIDDDGTVNTKMYHTGELFEASISKALTIGAKHVEVEIIKNKLETFLIEGDLESPLNANKNDLTFKLGKSTNKKGNDLLSLEAGLKANKKTVELNIFNVAQVSSQGVTNTSSFINASGELNLSTGELEHVGLGIYKGQFSILGKASVFSLKFEELKIKNEYPYLESFVLSPSNSNQLKIANFSLGLNSLAINVNADGKVLGRAEIKGALDLVSGAQQSITAKVGINFEARAAVVDGKSKFKFGKLDFDKIDVEGNMSSFGFKGSLDVFQDADRLGVSNLTGIEGKGVFWFNFLNKEKSQAEFKAKSSSAIGGGVYMVFAKNANGENAWGVDVDLAFPSGIPIGTTDLKGIYGGAYSNLSIDGSPIAKVSEAGSRTGLKYKWSPNIWGFNFGLDLTTAKSVDISAMLAVQGNINSGLQFIQAAGYARFQLNTITDLLPPVSDKMVTSFKKIQDKVSKVTNTVMPDLDNLQSLEADKANATGTDNGSESLAGLFNVASVNQGSNRIAAGLIMAYNFGNNSEEASFSVKMYPDVYLNLSTGITNSSASTTGFGLLYISESTKFLHLGKSNSINDRLGLYVNMSNTFINASVGINAYFMLGDKLADKIPDPIVPANFMGLFRSKSNDIGSIEKLDPLSEKLVSGSGLAFGAALSVSVGMKILGVPIINGKAGAGFDALLVNSNLCPNEGWMSSNSASTWNAQAQVYGYASAELNALGVSLLEMGVGFLLKAKIPSPIYAEGTFAAYVRIWKASASVSIHAKLGDESRCLDPNNAEIVENWKFVKSIIPTGIVSPMSNFHLKCEYPQDQLNKASSNTYKQAIRVRYVEDNGESTDPSSEWDWTTPSWLNAYSIDNIDPKVNWDGTIPFPTSGLKKNTKYIAKVSIIIYDNNNVRDVVKYRNEQGVTIKLAQNYEFKFTTNNTEFALTASDILAYPAQNQYNTYKEDYGGQAYVVVEPQIAQKIAAKCVGCTFQIGVFNNNQVVGQPSTFDLLQSVRFPINTLSNNEIYELRILANNSGTTSVIYQNHYFRTSEFSTYQAKMLAYEGGAKGSWNTEANVFDIVANESVDEVFSEEEYAEMAGAISLSQTNWLNNLQNEYTRFRNGFDANYVGDLDIPSVLLSQNRFPHMNNASITNQKGNNVQLVNKVPVFQLAGFGKMIFDLVEVIRTGGNFNEELLKMEENERICFDWFHNIKAYSYFKGRSWAGLPTEFGTLRGSLCFKNPEMLDFRDFSKLQKKIVVYCQLKPRDSQTIILNFDMKLPDGNTISFPNNFTIYNKNTTAYKLTSDKKLEKFTNVQAKSERDPILFGSIRTSVEGCPVASDFSVDANSLQYSFEVIQLEKPIIKPCLTIRKDEDSQANDVLTKVCQQACAIDAAGQVINQGACNECKAQMRNYSYSSNSIDYIIESWESDLKIGAQKVPSTMTLRLSNGKMVTIEEGNTYKKISLTLAEASQLSELLKIDVTADSPFICGDNVNDDVIAYNPMPVDGEGNTPLEACSSAKSVVLYTKSDVNELQENVSQFYAEIKPLTALSFAYYAQGTGANRKWLAFKNGVYQTENYCISTPEVEVSCQDIQSDEGGANYTITFYTDASHNKFMIPWNVPDQGYSFTLSNQQVITLMPSEVKSSTVYKFLEGATCQTVSSSNLGEGITIITPPKSDCETKPAQPSIVASTTAAAFGEHVTLTAQGCPNNALRWYDDSKAPTLSVQVLNIASYSVKCLDPQTNCLSLPTSIDIMTKAVGITTEKNYACDGEALTLVASNCAAAITWTSDDPNLVLPSQKEVLVRPTKTTTFKLKCSVSNKSSRYDEKEIVFRNIPQVPSITHNLESVVQNRICDGNSVVLSLTQACRDADASILWSTGAQTNTITVMPNSDATYFATCQDNFCSSSRSNTVQLLVNSLKKAVITHTLHNNNVCNNTSFTLSVNNCDATDVVRWYKNGQPTAIHEGTSLETSLTTSTFFTAKCTRNIGSSTEKRWCEGLVSDEMSIRAVSSSQMAVSLAISSSSICAYQNTTLTATGCKYGIIEWKKGDDNWATNSNPLVTSNAGDYYVRCNLNNNCFNTEHDTSNEIKRSLVVNPEPTAPNLTTDKTSHTICAGETIILSGTCSLGSIIWNNLSKNTITLTSTTEYTAVCRSDKECQTQTPANITVQVNPIPAEPTITNSLSRNNMCEYETTVLSASCINSSAIWENLKESLTKTGLSEGDYNYRALCEALGCKSSYTDHPIKVYNRPDKPSIAANNTEVCAPGSITLTVSGCDNKVLWSNNETSKSISVSDLGQHTFTAKCIKNDCESLPSDTITVKVKRKPDAPTLNASNICDGQATGVTYSCSNKQDAFTWSEGFSPNLKGTVGTFTYKAVCSNNGCASDEASKTQTVYDYPPTPEISITSKCDYTTLSVSNCNGTLSWSTEATTNAIDVEKTGDYTATCTSNGCSSSKTINISKIRITPIKPQIKTTNNEEGDIKINLCNDESRSFTSASNVIWYKNDKVVSSGESLDNQTAGVYKALVSSDDCNSDYSNTITLSKVSVNTPTTIAEERKCGESILSSSCEYGDLSWYNSLDKLIEKSQKITISSGQTTYKARCNNNGCVSSEVSKVTLDIKQKPNAITLNLEKDTRTNKCGSGDVELSVKNCNGNIIEWKVDNGAWSSGSNRGRFKIDQSKTIYARCTKDGCTGSEVSLPYTYQPAPNPPTIDYTKLSGCGYTLTASGCGGKINWTEMRWSTVWIETDKGEEQSITVGNPLSVTYKAKCVQGECIAETTKELPALSTKPDWADQGDTTVDCKVYHVKKDINPCSSTFNEVEEILWKTLNCDPNYQVVEGEIERCSDEISKTVCVQKYIDQNIYSPTYGQKKDIVTKVCSHTIPVRIMGNSPADPDRYEIAPDDNSNCDTSTIKWFLASDTNSKNAIGRGPMLRWRENQAVKVECTNKCGTTSKGTMP